MTLAQKRLYETLTKKMLMVKKLGDKMLDLWKEHEAQ